MCDDKQQQRHNYCRVSGEKPEWTLYFFGILFLLQIYKMPLISTSVINSIKITTEDKHKNIFMINWLIDWFMIFFTFTMILGIKWEKNGNDKMNLSKSNQSYNFIGNLIDKCLILQEWKWEIIFLFTIPHANMTSIEIHDTIMMSEHFAMVRNTDSVYIYEYMQNSWL